MMPSFEGNLLASGMKFGHTNGENLESLSHLGLDRYRDVGTKTDGQGEDR